jgi:hypothetical protein
VHNGGECDIIAAGGDTIDDSKYSTSKNPSTRLYYRLDILNVGVSDIKKHKCSGPLNGVIQVFYVQLILICMCFYILVISKMEDIFLSYR